MKEYIELEQETWDLYEKVLPILKEQFSKIDEICESNTAKVLHAFWENHVSESHFASTTGYGYDDLGRDTITDAIDQAGLRTQVDFWFLSVWGYDYPWTRIMALVALFLGPILCGVLLGFSSELEKEKIE